jgi:F-type H+-transporting ATPase subunit b
MIEINVTLIYQFINFFILIFFLNHFLFKPIMEVAERRNKKLRTFASDIAKFTQKADNVVTQYDEMTAEMKKMTAGILVTARQQSLAEHEKIIKESRNRFAQQMEKAKKEIKKESLKTSKVLQKEAEKISRDIATRLLGRRAG